MPRRRISDICLVDNCNNKTEARGWCKKHYGRWRRYGDPLKTKSTPTGEPMRFIKKVLEIDTDECIEWPFTKANYGYGEIIVDGRKRLAHRIVCEMAIGEKLPRNTDVAHSCNNRRCVNWKHVRPATRAENVADMIGHGTAQRGENSYLSKLTEADVREIRKLKDKMKITEIAKKFGVTHSTIYAIFVKKSWFWLED